jgi:hypothetical protein
MLLYTYLYIRVFCYLTGAVRLVVVKTYSVEGTALINRTSR